MLEFERGYKEGIALAKTDGFFSTSPKDLPDFMQQIIEIETDSYQKGFVAGYRDQKRVNQHRFASFYWGLWGVLGIGGTSL